MLHAREQVAKGRATALSEAFIAAVHPDSPGGQAAPGVDSGAPDHLPGARAEAFRPGLGPGDEQADAGVGELVVAHLQGHAAIAVGAAFIARPDGVRVRRRWQRRVMAPQLRALDPLPGFLAAREFHFAAVDGHDRNAERMIFITGGREPRAFGDHAPKRGLVVDAG